MAINAKFLGTEIRNCAYFNDNRQSTMDYYGFDSLRNIRFDTDVVEEYRKTRFSLLRRGFLGDVFSAAATDCGKCNACVPLRINTFEFAKTARQQKVLDNFSKEGGAAYWTTPLAEKELYDLYKKFLHSRFPNSPMLEDDFTDFALAVSARSDMLLLTNSKNHLLGYASVDRLGTESSLEYIAYDPDHSDLRLGNVAFLKTIDWAYTNLIPYVYIGPTNDTQSLRYKRYYSGLETFDGEKWIKYDHKKHTSGPDYDTLVQRFHLP